MPTVNTSTVVNNAKVRTHGALAPPYLWGIPIPTIHKWGPCTPLRPLTLECELCHHPDKAFVQLLLSDIRQGCNIGYMGPHFAYTAHNLQSAFVNPSILDDALHSECTQTRILGPFNAPPLPNLRCSGLGIVPKHDGGWRTIYHLSAPVGFSIHDFIDPSAYTLNYCTVDDAYSIVNKLGPGTLLSKIDLKNAFRLIPVRPADWNLLGIFWRGNYYVDTCLLFGLRSAPSIFNHLASAIHWILQYNYSVRYLLHYLDDFLTAGPPGSPECQQNLDSMLQLCHRINAPIKLEKVVSPTTQITFLGIVIDMSSMTASISEERKSAILSELQSFTNSKKRKRTKRQLLSLIGKLSFACKVVPAGQIFLRRLIDLSTTVQHLHHRLPITQEAHRDLAWWQEFLPTWSGTSLILDDHWTPSPEMELFTDASGTQGWGAFWNGRWLQSQWTECQATMPIVWKELYAIVCAVHSWGHLWTKQKILQCSSGRHLA